MTTRGGYSKETLTTGQTVYRGPGGQFVKQQSYAASKGQEKRKQKITERDEKGRIKEVEIKEREATRISITTAGAYERVIDIKTVKDFEGRPSEEEKQELIDLHEKNVDKIRQERKILEEFDEKDDIEDEAIDIDEIEYDEEPLLHFKDGLQDEYQVQKTINYWNKQEREAEREALRGMGLL